MDAFLISTGIVALAEIGDKTQLLTLVLAARYRKPWPIVAGIFVATLINHGFAGAVGAWLTSAIGPSAMRWVLGLSFLAMAVWMLIPDKLDDDTGESKRIGGVFLSTAVLFFSSKYATRPKLPRWRWRCALILWRRLCSAPRWA